MCIKRSVNEFTLCSLEKVREFDLADVLYILVIKNYQTFRLLNTVIYTISRFPEKYSSQKVVPLLRYLHTIAKNTATSSMAESQAQDRAKCIFCKIADGKEKNEILFEDEEVIVFEDIKPAAKFHFLVIPKEHIKDSKALVPAQLKLLDRLIEVGNNVLGEKLASDSSNDASKVQKVLGFHWPPFHTVSHLHLHVIAPSDQMGFLARTIFRPNSLWFVTPDYVRSRLLTAEKK